MTPDQLQDFVAANPDNCTKAFGQLTAGFAGATSVGVGADTADRQRGAVIVQHEGAAPRSPAKFVALNGEAVPVVWKPFTQPLAQARI